MTSARSIAEALFLEADLAYHDDLIYSAQRMIDEYRDHAPRIDSGEGLITVQERLDDERDLLNQAADPPLRRVTNEWDDGVGYWAPLLEPFRPLSMGEIAMSDITNADRAAWVATAIDAFTSECRMDGKDNQTKAKDLATNLVHYLRLECGLSFEEASNVIRDAVNMAEQETDEDGDEDDQPIEREDGVRLWATFRACAQTTVTATSLAEAIEKAKLEKDGFHKFEIESCDGDETVHVFGPEGDNCEDGVAKVSRSTCGRPASPSTGRPASWSRIWRNSTQSQSCCAATT